MDRKNLLLEIGYKLRKVREPLTYTVSQMADSIGNERTSYNRYEKGKALPKLLALYKLGNKFDVSLDWLIRNEGPMYYKEKESNEQKIIKSNSQHTQPNLDSMPADIKELLDHMEKIPLLRHEVLAFFLKFKDKNKEMVANAFNTDKEDL